MSETDLVNEIRLALSPEFPQSRLFRNNNGRLKDIYGNYITYGLGVGTSDLIGFHARLITPDLVGHTVAQFVAVEVKRPGARTDKKRLEAQQSFIDTVQRHGGLAGFAASIEQARQILNHADFSE